MSQKGPSYLRVIIEPGLNFREVHQASIPMERTLYTYTQLPHLQLNVIDHSKLKIQDIQGLIYVNIDLQDDT